LSKVVDRGRQLRRAFEPGPWVFVLRLAFGGFVSVRRMYTKEQARFAKFFAGSSDILFAKSFSIRGFQNDSA
jgi:hypothetical protein